MPHKDPEARRAYVKAYYARHRDHERARHKAWYEDNRQSVIANVATWRKQKPDSRSYEHRSRRYGIKRVDIDRMHSEQNGLCAICGEPPTGKAPMNVLHIDHDHATLQVRALLCHLCNKGLGAFRDNPALLAKAMFYLTRHRVVGEVSA